MQGRIERGVKGTRRGTWETTIGIELNGPGIGGGGGGGMDFASTNIISSSLISRFCHTDLVG